MIPNQRGNFKSVQLHVQPTLPGWLGKCCDLNDNVFSMSVFPKFLYCEHLCSMPNNMLNAKRKRGENKSSQVCVSKLTSGDKSFITMTGVDNTRDLPVWLEARVSLANPAVRELRMSKVYKSPAGLLQANAQTMTSMLRNLSECLEKEVPASGFAFSPVGEEEVPPLVEMVRAAVKFSAGMEKSAAQLYEFDREFDELVYDDIGVRTNTATRAGETVREAERIGLGRQEDRSLGQYAAGKLYVQDLGPNSKTIVDRFLKFIPRDVKYETIDAVMTKGLDGGVRELAKQLGKLKFGVAVSPVVHSRLKEVFPTAWAGWEAASRQKLTDRIRSVESSGCPTDWQSFNKTVWQVVLV